MSEEGGRRPKRRCVTRRDLIPSAVHYVGYVEDDETTEMIMKKFEALERVISTTAPNEGPSGVQSGTFIDTPTPDHASQNSAF